MGIQRTYDSDMLRRSELAWDDLEIRSNQTGHGKRD